MLVKGGVGDGIRTHDVRNHNPTLYQAELHPPRVREELQFTRSPETFERARLSGLPKPGARPLRPYCSVCTATVNGLVT